ncbi:YhgE/Pip domain-containing protein [Anaerosacchariphilus polymeriproducens]|uniref:YhgE/Pip domain-containing protein n=1 Tax=Anaerosacchariphilus polymeriproducens TaxID=1812858 RepID=A0A371ATN5_9FIRM|nr:YhgE/Pip domain-containing protein [Anaerosacchariphilus polymeriproducens]RDU22943.1 YhgE/Pip domain-containing protein [Anaerosacchariphilus polymeriproducens]
MLFEEWKSLFKNKFLIIVIIAIITIPSLYTIIFLGSMWDPYGSVENLPVAIVNKDKKVTYNGTNLNVGKDLINNLKENYFMDFNFVDEKTANEGLTNGTYYMVITIPDNFSANATTVTKEKPSKMELEYETNPGRNYIASKMSETALNKIEKSISEKVTEVYTKTVYEKISELGNGMEKAADGAGKINNGMSELSDGNHKITNNLNKMTFGTLSFKEGTKKLESGMLQYTNGVSAVKTGSKELSDGISSLALGANTLSTGVEKLSNGSSSLVTGVKDYTSGVDTVYAGTAELVKNNTSLNSGINTLSTGVTQLKSGSSNVLNGMQTMSDSIGSVMTEEQIQKISQLEQGMKTLNQSIQDLNTTLQSVDLSNPDTAAIIKSGVNQIAVNSNILIPGASESVKQLSTGLVGVKTVLDQTGTTAKDMGLIQGMKAIDSGISNIEEGINGTVESETDGLAGGIHAYTQGVEKVNNGVEKLSNNSVKLKNGATQLNTGIAQLKEKIPSLNHGVSKLNTGASSLYQGTSELVSKNETLLSGICQLSNASETINKGTSALALGSKSLGDGITKLSDGSNQLNSSLVKGADEIKKVNTSDDTVEMFAAPVETQKMEASRVDNNGTAMSAYMMTVALWIACLAICMFYPIAQYSGNLKSGFSWWLSKFSILGLVAIIQAAAMVFAIKGVHGFAPIELGKTVVVACMTSLAFMSIVLFFDISFGKVGSYLLLIMMLLQLSACAGTYPIELSGEFYHVISKFMPFTYAVDAFRNTTAIGGSIRVQVLVLLGIIIIFSLFTVSVYQRKMKKLVIKI